jgi:hypothetical protein
LKLSKKVKAVFGTKGSDLGFVGFQDRAECHGMRRNGSEPSLSDFRWEEEGVHAQRGTEETLGGRGGWKRASDMALGECPRKKGF